MKKLHILWKTMLCIFTFLLLLFSSTFVYKFFHARYGSPCDWRSDERCLSGDLIVREYNDGKVRVYDRHRGAYVTKKLDWISVVPRRDTLTVFSRHDKRGFLSVKTGKEVIPAQYEHAWIFAEGKAAVVINDKIGFIDARNEWVIQPQFNYKHAVFPPDYLFQDGLCVMDNDEGLFGIIDTAGNWVLKPRYDFINPSFSDKSRIVKRNGKYGILNESLSEIYPPEYDWIEYAEEGIYLTKNGSKQLVAFDGSVIIPFVFTDCTPLYYDGNRHYDEVGNYVGDEYVLSGYYKFEVDCEYGVMNGQGEIVIPARYVEIDMLGENTFRVQLGADNWTIINL